MTHALILNVPVELGLKLVPIVCPYLADAEGEASDDIVDESDGIGLSMLTVDLEGSDMGGIADSNELVTLDRLSIIVAED